MENRLLKFVNRRLLTVFALLSGIGLLNLYSASRTVPGNIFEKQLILFILGIGILLLAVIIDYRVLSQFGYYFYIFGIFLLVAVLLVGKTSSGAQRWLSLWGIIFQPSELAKLLVIVALAKFFETREERDGFGFRDLFFPIIIILLPAALIMVQPDLGTSLHIILTGASILIFVGIRFRTLITLSLFSITFLPIGWLFLKEYQKARLLSFINPNLDPLRTGYHVIQSQIAVGSGSILGKGFLKGTQAQLRFLPEQHTDFIFATLSEEWGFLGAFLVLGLFFILIYTIFEISLKAKDRFGYILCAGIGISLLLQVFINIAMVLGLLPVVGIPLPLFSYGRSALLIFLIEVGLITNVDIRRNIFKL